MSEPKRELPRLRLALLATKLCRYRAKLVKGGFTASVAEAMAADLQTDIIANGIQLSETDGEV